ncbi:FkbM family methyltransferase [Amorphus coralli]|uniref:FkbM family methyltransferase n=1 Tax=Amorphus coralli TaxID=340680 RepID=UPI000381CE76|nr:FkbM family methyltransferase [Amorphus coralli]
MALLASRTERARLLFRQFRGIDAARLLVTDVVRLAADRFGIASYSQTGEDRIIDAILGDRQGYYVDVGCNHPVRCSSTFFFYRRGWRGLCIDANEALVALYRRARPHDRAVCAVVSSSTRDLVFTEFADDRISSVDPDHSRAWSKSREVTSERHVRAVTLQSLLEAADAPNRFDLLAIDVEGHDLEVLFSLDLGVYRPALIVIEMHGFDLERPKANPIYRHLAEAGYQMVGYAVMNGYFVDSETA